MKKVWLYVACLAFCLWAGPVAAGELVWTPVNPSFGGNPLNGTFLLNQAEMQNHFPEEVDSLYGDSSTIDDFEESLTRRILTQLANQIVDSAFGGSDTDLGSGTYEFGSYIVEIDAVEGSSINVTIVDSITGESTSVEVPYYN